MCLHLCPYTPPFQADSDPYFLRTSWRVPFPLLPKVEAELKHILSLGITEGVTQPTDWCVPVVPMKKIKKKTKYKCELILNISTALLRKVHSAISRRHCSEAGQNWHIFLEENNQKLTTFITPISRFCFCCLESCQLQKSSKDRCRQHLEVTGELSW